MNIQLPGFDLREIENVIEDLQERIRRRLYGREVSLLLGRELRRQRQLGHAENGIHRRADFMAHVRQELTLGLVRRFGPDTGFLQLL